MANEVEIIMNTLILDLKKLGNLLKQEINEESFKLVFEIENMLFFFFCSLHHLDIPWQISSEIYKNGAFIGKMEQLVNENYTYDTPTYEISPVFLSNVNENTHLLSDKIKKDIQVILQHFRE